MGGELDHYSVPHSEAHCWSTVRLTVGALLEHSETVGSKALRMAFFSTVSVWVQNTSKPLIGFMTGFYRVFK